MKLSVWLAEDPERRDRLVKELDCHPKSVWRYETGRKIPEPVSMRRIYVFSDGAVDPNSFYSLPEIKPGRKSTKPEAKARRSA